MDIKSVGLFLHKRRVSQKAACGDQTILVCRDYHAAFSAKQPRLCKFSLANALWLDRPDPSLWEAKMTHEMCLSLARTGATASTEPVGGKQRDAVRASSPHHCEFQQAGYVGSSIVFHNGDAKHALDTLPAAQFNDSLAIAFCTDLPQQTARIDPERRAAPITQGAVRETSGRTAQDESR